MLSLRLLMLGECDLKVVNRVISVFILVLICILKKNIISVNNLYINYLNNYCY